MSTDVATPRKEYTAMLSAWQQVNDLNGGTDAMRNAGEKYLPKMPKESNPAYQTRLAATVLFNAYARTVETLVGKPLSSPVVRSEDMPEEVQEMLENVDLEGRDIDVFSWPVFQAALDHGLTHIFVDFPVLRDESTGEVQTLTLTEASEKKIRPYAVHVPATRLIGWRSKIVGGVQVLTQIRMLENVQVDKGAYGVEDVERVRVVNIDSFEVWEKSEGKMWAMTANGPMTLGFIPLVTLYAKQTGFMTGKPALKDLADLNVTHWQSSSDQRNILHVARVPFLFASGLDDDASQALEIGANRIVYGPQGSTLSFVEHSGNAIDAGQKDLEMLKTEMSMMGTEFIMSTTGTVTATEKAIDSAAGDSALALTARAMNNALSTMLDYFAAWQGKEAGSYGTLSVNTDFRVTLNSADLTTLMQARQAGDISRDTFWAELVRRDVLGPTFDKEEELDRLDDEETKAMDKFAKTQAAMGNKQEDDENDDAGNNFGGTDNQPPTDE